MSAAGRKSPYNRLSVMSAVATIPEVAILCSQEEHKSCGMNSPTTNGASSGRCSRTSHATFPEFDRPAPPKTKSQGADLLQPLPLPGAQPSPAVLQPDQAVSTHRYPLRQARRQLRCLRTSIRLWLRLKVHPLRPLHPRGRHAPHRRAEVHLAPFRLPQFARPHENMRQQLHGELRCGLATVGADGA